MSIVRNRPRVPLAARKNRNLANGYFRGQLRGNAMIAAFAGAALIVTGASPGEAHEAKSADPNVNREILAKTPIPDHPGHVMTALTIELAPGTVVGPHRHGGMVYVYVLQGRVRSHLEEEAPRDYVAGQSWVEPAGVLHRRAENPSDTEIARILAVVYGKADALITQPEGAQK